MLKLKSIIGRGVEFGADEQLLQFRFRLLTVSLVAAMVFSLALVLATWMGLSELGRFQLVAVEAFLVINLMLVILLWSHRDRFVAVAWIFFTVWFLVDVSALCLVTGDEFRAIWFYLEGAAVYAILGTLPGLFTLVVTFATLVVVNAYLLVPFSNQAMVTMIFSLCVAGVFLHAYTKRFIDFNLRAIEANALLREMASRDPLTGIQNARAFYETCDHLIRDALGVGASFSALFIDVDHFKSINDRYGHEAGDVVLKEVAACLSKHTRRSDALGRIGGEEFLMLLPNTDLSGAKLLAEKLRENVEALMPSTGATRIRVTVSIGVARNHADHKTIAEIKHQADQAMYLAKASGRNRVMALDNPAPA